MSDSERLNPDDVRLFCGSSNPAFAEAVARYLQVPLSPSRTRRFSNDCMHIQLGETVRGRVVFIFQSLCPPVNDHVIEMLMMLDAARTAGSSEVHAIIPYYSYGRSDKKDAPRISITSRLIAHLIQTAGATHVMIMSLHAPQVHGFFDVPTDPLTARPVFETYFRQQDLSNTIVVAPDAGRARSAGRFATSLGLPVAVGNKKRISDQEVLLTGIIGDVAGKEQAIIYDDEIAWGGSTLAMLKLLLEHGIRQVRVVCTHGIFTGNALNRLGAAPELVEVVTSDTVPIPEAKRIPKLRVLSVTSLFGEAIRRNWLRQSIGNLFTFWEEFEPED